VTRNIETKTPSKWLFKENMPIKFETYLWIPRLQNRQTALYVKQTSNILSCENTDYVFSGQTGVIMKSH